MSRLLGQELTVFGFVSNYSKKLTPLDIIQLIIAFYDLGDEFDIFNIGICHTLKRNVITCNGHPGSSSYLLNTITDSKHIWGFRIKSKTCKSILVGIWKTNSGNPQTATYFWLNNNGYGYWVGDGEDHNYNKYGIKCKFNDIISMCLDMNRLELSYSVNDKNIGIMTQIEETKYTAAVYMLHKHQSLELLSYRFK